MHRCCPVTIGTMMEKRRCLEGGPSHIMGQGDLLDHSMDSPNQQEQQQQWQAQESYAEDFFARYAEGILEDGAADDDESEDIDWKPYMRWFCINCTCPNPDEATHCIRCGEHRTSGILNQGYLASSFDSAGDMLLYYDPSFYLVVCLAPEPVSATILNISTSI